MTRFQCTCGMVISTPATRTRCLRCRQLLGWHERLPDAPATESPTVVAIARHARGAGLDATVANIAATTNIANSKRGPITPARANLRPTHLTRITTTISVLLSRPRRRLAAATND
ncbi:MAG: hypothetical protein AB7U73_24960 [Pirellulales bacterium]